MLHKNLVCILDADAIVRIEKVISVRIAGAVILNLGCGNDKSIVNAVTVDNSPGARPDVLHDLDSYPWPFEDNSVSEIHCKDVIEHLDSVVAAMEEMHRILKPNGRLYITTPHFSCYNSYLDPTHRWHLSYLTFDLFTGTDKTFFTTARFRKVSSTLVFHLNLKNKIVSRIANRHPEFYEKHLAWVFPAWFMIVELEAHKST
jgi:SAM-dependent methyltransferase